MPSWAKTVMNRAARATAPAAVRCARIPADLRQWLGRPKPLIDNTTNQHVFDQRPIAVQEDDGRAVAIFDVVEPHAIDGQELASGQIIALGLGRAAVDQHG